MSAQVSSDAREPLSPPRRLAPGAHIAVIAPSSPFDATTFELGVARLRTRYEVSFDPALHEALSQQETTEVAEGLVISQNRKGYRMKDRLLRPAAVVVARKPGSATANTPSQS